MQLDSTNRPGSTSTGTASTNAANQLGTPMNRSRTNRSRPWARIATKLGLVTAAALSVSSTGCRSCLDLCHWHQRPVRMHSVHYHVLSTANPQVCAPVALPVPPSNLPSGMMGGNGISEPVPLHQADQVSGEWPGEPAVEVAPVPREWDAKNGAPVAQPMENAQPLPGQEFQQGMADLPGAIEIPDSDLPPIRPAPDSPLIEL